MYRHTVCLGVLLGFFATIASPTVADALPRMSAASGAPCSTCHYSPDGGGLRTEIGFGTQADIGALDYGTVGLDFLDERHTNKALDWLAVGADVRIQSIRGRQPSEIPDGGELPPVRVFPMQLEPQVGVFPTDWLTLLGSWTPGPDIGDGDFCSGAYPGQACGSLSAVFTPPPEWPKIRAGFFRPNTGILHDDHTMLVEADAARTDPTVIPPNWAELGVEASYQPRHWFRLDAGGFRSDQIAEAIGDDDVVTASDPGYLGRVSFMPRFDFGPDYSFYGWAGASVYGTGDFLMNRGFVGFGWLDRASLKFDLAHLHYGPEAGRTGLNASTTLSVPVQDWVVPELRVEQATTFEDDDTAVRRAAVAGVQFYPFPFIKLRPEYRFVRTDNWQMGQYAVQLHLFY